MRVGTYIYIYIYIYINSLLTVNIDMHNHSRFPLSVQLDGLYVVAIFLPSVVGENCSTDFICLAATPVGVHDGCSSEKPCAGTWLFTTAATF